LRKRALAVFWLSSIVLSAPAARFLNAAKYPPSARWREIGRGGFTIVFPRGRGAEAMAALATAERLGNELARFWRFRLPGRARIVLGDFTDDANGFATFFPFNLVGADLAEPPPDDELAGSGPLLDLVLAHELTHLFTMNAGAPAFRAARRLFGSHPGFYPAMQMPPWAIEGLAVEGESRLSGDGRLNNPPFRLMLDAARRDGLFPDWRSLSGMTAAWPGPNGKYLFGAGFMEFLAARHGGDSLRRYAERVASRVLTVGSGRDFKRTFAEPLTRLWSEYRNAAAIQDGPRPEPLTQNGFFQQYPCPLGESGLAYYRRDFRRRGEVALLDLKTGRDKPLLRIDGVNGLCAAGDGRRILLSAVDRYHAFNDFSDLYEYDVERDRLKRLSAGQRLSHPACRQGSPEIYCVRRQDGRYRLARFDRERGVANCISRSFAGMAQPAVSPDGNLIAAAVKPEGGPWALAIFTATGEVRGFVPAPDANLSQPRWLHDSGLLFILADRDSSRLASFSLGDGVAAVCDDPRLLGLRQFSLAADGGEIFFTFLSGRGQEIASCGLGTLPFVPCKITAASGIVEGSAAGGPAEFPASRPYRFWRDLLPRWWSPAWRMGGDELQLGAMTSGQDAPAVHSYALEAYYGLASRQANVSLQYVYEGLFPTLSLAYQDSSEYDRRGSTLRSRKFKFSSLWPLRLRRRSQLHAYADLHLESRRRIDEAGTLAYEGSADGARLGMQFNTAREYYDSISPSDGVRFALQGSFHPAGLGNEWESRDVQAELRHYIPLFRPGVLAWRLALARCWGTKYPYEMGGSASETLLGGSQPFKLLRGFASGYQAGDRGWQANLEVRLPLFGVEKAVLPTVSLDRVWLAAFVDAGRLFVRRWEAAGPVAWSAGVEAALRFAVGSSLPYDIALGLARGFGPERQWRLYLRTGRSF
jgi:hypothetical protein